MCRTRRDALASTPRPLSSSHPTPISPSSSQLSLYSAATINPISPSSSSRSSLRGRDVFILRRPFRADPTTLPARLARARQSHHRSLIPLLAASLSANTIHLVYEFAPGTPLSTCLHTPSFTPLPSWLPRMQIAADLAQGLDYIHHHAAGGGSVHNRIKSSSVIVSDNNAKICHFGAALLAGDLEENGQSVKIEATRGYLAPEVIAGGRATKKSDVFAFGVVLLELISGDEPLEYKVEEKRCERVSVIETAKEVVAWVEREERMGRVRRWVDRRLRDSFPVEVAEKMTVVALRCVDGDAAKRPGMSWVQGKISQLLLESKVWSHGFGATAEMSATFGPR